MSFRDVVADVDGRSLAAAAADIEATVDALPFPLEYHAEVLDDFAEEADARARVSATAVASALAIFLLLQAAFASWRLATLGAVALLAAVSGGLVAVSLAGATVGLGSLIGLAALLGFAARSIILLVRHYRRLERAEPDGSVADLVLRGTQERVVPTVTSALAVAAVLGPFAVAGGAIGLELVQPVAVVVLAGLVTSVVTTLVVVPSLYLAYGFVSRPDTTTEDLLALPEVEPHRPLAGTTGP